MLTAEDLRVLGSSTPQRLAEMACLLNMWEWPEELPDPEQPNFRIPAKGAPAVNTRRTALRNEIERRVGNGAINQEWNSKRNGKKRGRRKYSRPLDPSLNYLPRMSGPL